MKIELWGVDKPRPYERNARKISALAIEKVARSIQDFGWQQPIVVDRDGVIIAGHTRLLAAKKLGQKTVPVYPALDLSPEQVKAYRLADNRSHEEAEWDLDMLGAELFDLKGLGFDLVSTAFDEDELAQLFSKGQVDDEDVIPSAPANPVTVTGDVFRLGTHRLMCGDSTKAADVGYLLEDAKPLLMVTDPPYGVDPDWRNRAKRAGSMKAYGASSTGTVTSDDRADWRDAWKLFPGDVVYVWHGALHATVVADSLTACDFEIRAQIVWVKQHAPISRGHYHWQHEPCWYAVRRGGTGHWQGDRKQTTAWQLSNGNAFGGSKDPDNKMTGHGTQKPVECMRRPVLNNSKPGDAVYEPFCGSGTTLIACESEGRRCYAMEVDPVYCDVIIARWEAATGKKAVLVATGQTLDQLREERLGVVA